ncbi:MAG: type II secretion system major pseudopilin GspG [Pseudomonadota bacterium]
MNQRQIKRKPRRLTTRLYPSANAGARQRGFTLIEIMVVVVIIGMLATLILPKVLGRQDQAFQAKAKADIRALSSAVKLYKLDKFKYPAGSEGLNSLVSTDKGYIDRLPKDPWGNDYQYQSPGQNLEFDIWTMGADGQSGGSGVNQDIGNWNMDEVK